MNQQKKVAVLLVVSSFLLAILVPGGPIETRSFSHISPLILGSFNTFLTLLGMLSLPLAYFVFNIMYYHPNEYHSLLLLPVVF